MNHSTAQRGAAHSDDGTTESDSDGHERGRGGLDLRRGTEDDLKHILYLIDETAEWLARLGTDQWRRPWPNRPARDERVRSGLAEGRTWTVWDLDRLAATVTVQRRSDPRLWPRARPDEAVYPCRLVVDRDYAGHRLGAELMDWVGRSSRDGYGARFIRIDVWTTNRALHDYYKRHGFESRGHAPLPDSEYPARALFEKPTEGIGPSTRALFARPMPDPFRDPEPTTGGT